LAPQKRAAILKDIGTGLSRNQIARKHGVSASLVGKIAAQEGITDAWDRTHTLKGARAKAADNKAKRAQLQSDLLDDAQKLRARAWASYKIVVGGPEGAEVVELDLPPLPDVRAAYTSIGIIVDKDAAIERNASDEGADQAKSMLGKLFEGLAAAVGETETPQDDG
jgi:transposase-like protein